MVKKSAPIEEVILFTAFYFSLFLILLLIVRLFLRLIIRYTHNIPIIDANILISIFLLLIGVGAFIFAGEKKGLFRLIYLLSFFIILCVGIIVNLDFGQNFIRGDAGYYISVILFVMAALIIFYNVKGKKVEG